MRREHMEKPSFDPSSDPTLRARQSLVRARQAAEQQAAELKLREAAVTAANEELTQVRGRLEEMTTDIVRLREAGENIAALALSRVSLCKQERYLVSKLAMLEIQQSA